MPRLHAGNAGNTKVRATVQGEKKKKRRSKRAREMQGFWIAATGSFKTFSCSLFIYFFPGGDQGNNWRSKQRELGRNLYPPTAARGGISTDGDVR